MTTRAAGEQRQFQNQYQEALDRVVELEYERARLNAKIIGLEAQLGAAFIEIDSEDGMAPVRIDVKRLLAGDTLTIRVGVELKTAAQLVIDARRTGAIELTGNGLGISRRMFDALNALEVAMHHAQSA